MNDHFISPIYLIKYYSEGVLSIQMIYASFKDASFCFSGPHSVRMRKITDHKNTEYGHFSHSGRFLMVLLPTKQTFVINPYQANITLIVKPVN